MKKNEQRGKLLRNISRGPLSAVIQLPMRRVPFIARTSVGGEEKITARMSDGLEKALRGYAPGSELTYKKMDFVVGGIFIEYMPRREIPKRQGNLKRPESRQTRSSTEQNTGLKIRKRQFLSHVQKSASTPSSLTKHCRVRLASWMNRARFAGQRNNGCPCQPSVPLDLDP